METARCQAPGCKRAAERGGMCLPHHRGMITRERNLAKPAPQAAPRPKLQGVCQAGSCRSLAARDGYCRVHWWLPMAGYPMQERYASRFKVETFRDSDVMGIRGAPRGASPTDICWIIGQPMEPAKAVKRK